MAYQTPWSKTQRAWLRRWAGKYIWWKTPREALQQPQRILAQVMALGEYSDAQTVVEVFGEDALRETLRQAEVRTARRALLGLLALPATTGQA